MAKKSKPKIGLLSIVLAITIVAALVWKHTSAPSHALEEPLVIAYGDDIAGIILQKALADLPAERADLGLDAINMGDCCGSNAQFALSTGQVDVAVLCPDAMLDLADKSGDIMRTVDKLDKIGASQVKELLMGQDLELTQADTDRLGAETVALTHGEPEAYVTAAALTHMLCLLLKEPDMPIAELETKAEAFALGLKLAKEIDADLVLGTDPDCDRVGIAVRHNGEYKLMTGNEVGAIFCEYLLSS